MANLATLATFRERIDALDDQIIKLLCERAHIVEQVPSVKPIDAPKMRPDREALILRRMSALNTGPLSDAAVVAIYREIISQMMALEQQLQVAYLGPEGTFSQAAATKHFGTAPAFEPCATIDEVFRQVESEAVDYGVVPVVNSTEGFVGRTLDLALSTPLKVCAEIDFRVQQNLMSIEADASKITRVYSHAQSLSQTANWLAAHLPHAERIPVASNAEAARMASTTLGSAAIAGELAAMRYNVPILYRHIEDSANNTTRFWVLGRQELSATGRDKTSLILSAPNKPGAVVDLIAPFKKHGVSMSHFESHARHLTVCGNIIFSLILRDTRQNPMWRRHLSM